MIFAAGLGTRLRPLTDTMPKALVPVGGETLISRVIHRLSDIGTNRIIVNVHHFSEMIVEYLKENDNFGLDIRISDESDKLLETGGGIRKAIPLFDTSSPILIHNVDILSNVDLGRFYDRGLSHDATLLVSERKTKRYLLFDDEMKLVGWTNTETGEVKSPYINYTFPYDTESQRNECEDFVNRHHKFAFSGIHTFSPSLFPLMDVYPDRFPIIDFYLQQCDKVDIRGYLKTNLKLMDVGKIETLSDADDFIAGLG